MNSRAIMLNCHAALSASGSMRRSRGGHFCQDPSSGHGILFHYLHMKLSYIHPDPSSEMLELKLDQTELRIGRRETMYLSL